jgi:hypothetical protein
VNESLRALLLTLLHLASLTVLLVVALVLARAWRQVEQQAFAMLAKVQRRGFTHR